MTTSMLGTKWQRNVFATVPINDPVTILDCLNFCLNVRSGSCDFFVLDNSTCFLGAASVSNGTVLPSMNETAKIFSLNCKEEIMYARFSPGSSMRKIFP